MAFSEKFAALSHEPFYFLGFSANNLCFMDRVFNYGMVDMPIITCLLIKGFVEFLPSVRPDLSVFGDSVDFRESQECSLCSALLNDGFLVSSEPPRCGPLYLQFLVFLEFMPFLHSLTPSAVRLSEPKVSCRVVDVLSTFPFSSELYWFPVLTLLYFVLAL